MISMKPRSSRTFKLDNMMDAMFDMANRLFDMTFTENTGTVPVFEPEVRTFEVKRGDQGHRPVFYLDNFAREGKRSGAWMTTYRSQNKLSGKNRYVFRLEQQQFCSWWRWQTDTDQP